MPLDTYADLISELKESCVRPDWSDDMAKMLIKRAEDKLNRSIPVIEKNASLTGVAGSRDVSTAGLSIRNTKALWITDNGDEDRVNFVSPENMTKNDDRREPLAWTWDQVEDKITFDTLLDMAYPIRLLYVERFALSDAVTTNWLLAEHADLYIDACICEGWRHQRDYQAAREYERLTDQGIRSVKYEIAKRKRGMASVPKGLLAIGPGAYFGDGDYSL